MRKSFFFKTTALAVCLVFLAVAVPGLNSAEKKNPKFDARLILKKPVALLSSIFPVFSSIFDTGSTLQDNTPTESNGKVRITGGLPSPRVSE